MGIPNANAGHLRENEITIPEILKEQGYTTGHFGKWHLGTLTTKVKDANRGRPGDSTHYSIPTMHGYDEYFATESKVPTYDPMIKPAVFDTALGEGLRFGWQKVEIGESFETYGTYYWDGVESMVSEGLEGDNSKVIMDRVLPFVENAVAKKQPFFATVWLHTPHLPVVADSNSMHAYRQLDFKEQIYSATISSMDTQLGRLDAILQQLGVADNTLIWFCSDNGPEVRTPGSSGIYRGRKRDLYEGGIRVPAFIRFPEKLQPGKRNFPMSTYDILPTILDFLRVGLPIENALDGISLMQVLTSQTDKRDKPIGFRYRDKMAWTLDTLKLVSTDSGKTFELYDLIQDPKESHDIADQNPDKVQEMKTQLEQWIASCDEEYATSY